MDLRVRVLGEFAVDGIPAARLARRKGRTLLKILALARGQPVSVDRIVDALWPADPPSRPSDQVSVLVSRLRATLGGDRIRRSDAGYALHADWLDVAAAEELAAEAAGRPASALHAYAEVRARLAEDLGVSPSAPRPARRGCGRCSARPASPG